MHEPDETMIQSMHALPDELDAQLAAQGLQSLADQRLLAAVVEQATEMIVIIDLQGKVQYVNPAFTQHSGYTLPEIHGKPIVHYTATAGDTAKLRRIWVQLQLGISWTGHLCNLTRDGSEYETQAILTPIKDGEGNITHFVGLFSDLSDTLNLRRQLLQSRKMEAIGTLASGIAHDFNNILAVIFGFNELARMDASEGSDMSGYLEEIAIAANRARDLVRQILTFTRQTELERKPVMVSVIVKEALKLMRASIPTTIRFEQDVATDALISAAPTQVHQILMNLCTNAWHAMSTERGVLYVGLHEVDFSSIPPSVRQYVVPGRYLRLRVTDTGDGMTPEVKERIFEPYFTTKEKGEGTGMGLSIVLGIVKGYDGTIYVTSNPGEGATFDVYLPVYDPGLDEVTELGTEPRREVSACSVLFVDDEKAITRLHQMSLEKYGYTVSSFTSSLQALQAFRKAPRRFDILITDLTMPELTGPELARAVRQMRPDMPVIICSGFARKLDDLRKSDPTLGVLLRKPILPHDLVNTIEDTLKGIDDA